MSPIDWDSLPREDLLRRIDGLASHLSAVLAQYQRGCHEVPSEPTR